MGKNMILWIAVIALVVIAVGGGLWFVKRTPGGTPVTSTTPSPAVSVPTAGPTLANTPIPASGQTVELSVEGSSFKFTPSQLKVKKGDTVRLTFKNAGGMHDFVIDEFDVKTNTIGDGEEEEVEFVADKTGSFEYYCSVGNHRAMGMTGTLVVE